MTNKPQKIHICGTHGSGKSTFAKLISHKLKIPFYLLEDTKYIVKYSKQRSEEEMRRLVKELSSKKKWITEECWGDRAEPLFKKADLVILMLTPKTTNQYRILKRFLTRKKQEKDTLKQTLSLCRKVRRYDKDKHPVSLDAHKKLIKKYKKKTIIIENKKQLNEFLEEFLKK